MQPDESQLGPFDHLAFYFSALGIYLHSNESIHAITTPVLQIRKLRPKEVT